MRILLVEDDILIAKSLTQALMGQHYALDIAADGEAGWEAATLAEYDLILLDVMMPRLDGVSLCRRLRSQGTQTPILMLTTRDRYDDRVLGLDAGADDYVTKPFDLSELLARIRALLRRNQAALMPQLEWEQLQLDLNTCQVSYQGQPLHLTPKEYGLLELLLRNPQRIYRCSALIDHLWSFEDPPTEETVRSHVKGVRQKLKTAGANDPIETIYGMGYRLRTPQEVRLVSEKSAVINSNEATPDDANFDTEVAAIWTQAQAQIGSRVNIIEAAIDELSHDRFTPALQQQAAREAHKLAGSLGIFGSDRGSELAHAIEPLLAAAQELDSDQRLLLSNLVVALRQELPLLKTEPLLESPADAVNHAVNPETIQATVMIVDDDPAILKALQALLMPWGLHVCTCDRPLKCLEVLASRKPDLLVLDVEMPEMSGIELCQKVRNQPQGSDVPILFLTAHTDAKTLDQVFSVGADDFVSKPIVGPELVSRILNRLERSRLLRQIADLDPLTGVANRRKSTQQLQQLLDTPDHQPVCLAVLTLSNLKQINRQYGHAAGDQILAEIGEQLRQLFPNPAVIGHWGGTEFVIGMVQTSKLAGLQQLRELLQNLHQQSILRLDGVPLQIRVRIGVAQSPDDGTNLRSLYHIADSSQATVTPRNSRFRSESRKQP